MAANTQGPATKHDLAVLKKELKQEVQQMFDVQRLKLIDDFKVVAENLTYDYNGIFKDRTSQHSDRLDQHEERISVLEGHAGHGRRR